MGWHSYQNAWVHVDNDGDFTDPEFSRAITRARNEVDELLKRQILVAELGQNYPVLTNKTPRQIWQEYLSDVPGSEIYVLNRPGRYEIKIIEGMPVIYMATFAQVVKQPREVSFERETHLRQPVPCYDLVEDSVFKGFVICGLGGNRWNDPRFWQPEDPDLPYGSEEVLQLRVPAGYQHTTGDEVSDDIDGMLTELKPLDIISEKNGRMDDTYLSIPVTTYFDTESHWIDVDHNHIQPDYPEPAYFEGDSMWEAAGFGMPTDGFPCADCANSDTDWGGKDLDSHWYICDVPSGYVFTRHVTQYCACSNACWTADLGMQHCARHIGSRPYPAHAPAWMHPDYCLFYVYDMWKGHMESECFAMCFYTCNSWWVGEGEHGGCTQEDIYQFCACNIEKTREKSGYIISGISVDGNEIWTTQANYWVWQKWHVEGCHECDCATMWEKQTQDGQTLILEDYAIVAPGFEDRGYDSGEHWMALVQELVYSNNYQFEISPPHHGPQNTDEACEWQTDPYVEVYPYRWTIVFDDGTRWVVHDPGDDQDAVWTDTFRIYDFHGKPVYIGGIFISQEFGSDVSKRVYFMYYDGEFYMEDEVYPDHSCAWFGCYEHDVYGTVDGLLLIGGEAKGYGGGWCRAVGRYDTFWERVTETLPDGPFVEEV